MPNIVVVGTQWGDEGKAKIIDYLASQADAVYRFNGGKNAGHTTKAKIKDELIKFIFHLMPAGALYEGTQCVIGNGVVLEPFQLSDEIRELQNHDIDVMDRLFISTTAHVTLDYHMTLDGLEDDAKGSQKIGTTRRGIGPTYADKAAKVGIRVGDLLDKDVLRSKLEIIAQEKDDRLQKFGQEPLDIDSLVNHYHTWAKQFEKNIVDTVYFLDQASQEGKNILFEGAQATFLDVDHGTYPFSSSSNATAGGACTGTGIGPKNIDKVIGVVKAYTTRVGEGGFATELGDYQEAKDEKLANDEELFILETKVNVGEASEYEIGRYIRGVGKEYGATTGRPRRCGWLDAVMIKKAVIVNSLDEIAITKLDVLDHLEEIKICVAYEIDGQRTEQFPAHVRDLDRVKPIYETLPGWKEDISQITDYDQLPDNAKAYLRRIEQLTKTRISMVSVGPERTQTIVRK